MRYTSSLDSFDHYRCLWWEFGIRFQSFMIPLAWTLKLNIFLLHFCLVLMLPPLRRIRLKCFWSKNFWFGRTSLLHPASDGSNSLLGVSFCARSSDLCNSLYLSFFSLCLGRSLFASRTYYSFLEIISENLIDSEYVFISRTPRFWTRWPKYCFVLFVMSQFLECCTAIAMCHINLMW